MNILPVLDISSKKLIVLLRQHKEIRRPGVKYDQTHWLFQLANILDRLIFKFRIKIIFANSFAAVDGYEHAATMLSMIQAHRGYVFDFGLVNLAVDHAVVGYFVELVLIRIVLDILHFA